MGSFRVGPIHSGYVRLAIRRLIVRISIMFVFWVSVKQVLWRIYCGGIVGFARQRYTEK